MRRFFEQYGEALIFALAITVTFTVVIPTMDAADAAKHSAHMASKD